MNVFHFMLVGFDLFTCPIFKSHIKKRRNETSFYPSTSNSVSLSLSVTQSLSQSYSFRESQMEVTCDPFSLLARIYCFVERFSLLILSYGKQETHRIVLWVLSNGDDEDATTNLLVWDKTTLNGRFLAFPWCEMRSTYINLRVIQILFYFGVHGPRTIATHILWSSSCKTGMKTAKTCLLAFFLWDLMKTFFSTMMIFCFFSMLLYISLRFNHYTNSKIISFNVVPLEFLFSIEN